MAANRQWLDHHFLPPFFVSRDIYVLALSLMRLALVLLGAALALLVRPRIMRFIARTPPGKIMGDVVRVSIAIVLALGASEMILRLTFRHSSEEQPVTQVPWRRRDSRLGWVFVPARTGRDMAGGRMIEYAFDPAGYRVRRSGDAVDPGRPTILFTGESIMAGQGLTWEETVPAQVEKLMSVQTANIAVHGFASDQAYLRLSAELPRFRRPLAVVALFTPQLFDRNLDEDRPHLGPGLAWLPGQPRWRLAMIASWLMPYRSADAIEQGIVQTREVLRATVELARARGATPLILVPQFLPEGDIERALRRRILDETGLPYVWVGLDPNWRLPYDRHPDARSAQAMAVAVASHLQGR